MKFTLITGNQHKLAEWQRMLPADFEVTHQAIDLDEIQSLDTAEIARRKVHEAYKIVNGPVVVEDVSAEVDDWNGLPGPFIKFFNERLGKDALYKLAGEGAGTTAMCTIAYYDGTREYVVEGRVHGTIVAPRVESFGFDGIFVPDGQSKTYAEMAPEEKDQISHRRLALDELTAVFKQL